jgi:putative transposase
MKLTVKIKLLPDAKQKQSLLKTMQVFNSACDYISKVAFKENKFSQVPLHRLTYRDIRERFNLPSQLCIRAIDKVAQSYKVEKKTMHKFKKYSAVVYDQRVLSFKGLTLVSILTVDCRYKIPIVFGAYARLEDKRILGQADLTYERGKFFLNLVIELPDGTPIEYKDVVGVDMGIVNIATTSDGENFSARAVDKVREKISRLKRNLQKCGTKNAKRHLKKLSDREARFKKNVNHRISKQIVSIAKGTSRAIAIENLKGFRAMVRKADRERFGKWSFNQLRTFMEYKARLAGIPVLLVNPRNTSRTCSQCGYISRSNRKSQALFSCKNCGFSTNADLNASKVIALTASVNTRIAVGSDSLNIPTPRTASSPTLVGSV